MGPTHPGPNTPGRLLPLRVRVLLVWGCMVKKRNWTEREVEILREMMRDSYPHAAIATRLGRTVGQIRDKWRSVKGGPKDA